MRGPRLFARPWQAALCALLALGIGGQAQLSLAGARPLDGCILYLAAALLFAVALGDTGRAPMAAQASPAALRSMPRMRLTCGGASILLALAALVLFELPGNDGWAWLLHILSVLLLILAILPWRLRAAMAKLGVHKVAVIAVALLLVAAFIPRYWQAAAVPEGVWFDEARLGVVARNILNDASYRPVYIPYIERPAQHAYLVALSFALFGANLNALRLIPELFGVLNVLMAALLLGRWLRHGLGGALVAGVFLAAMRWDLTLSRFALDTNSVPFFVMLVWYFLDRGLEQKDAPNFVLAGLSLGFGLAFYLPIRIFAAMLAMLGGAAALAATWRCRSLRAIQPWLPNVLAFALGLAVGIAPVAEYALTNTSIFFDRNNSASIFYQPEEPDIRIALLNNLVRYAGMFNYRGDLNGQRNLPGAPMLDPLMGMLFVLGFALAVRRWREWPNRFMLLTFAAMLLAGILSADWEAPQALRVIGVIPPIVYFCALALLAVADAFNALFAAGSHARWAVGAAVALVLVIIATLNFGTYFKQQATDPAVWTSYSIEETWIGKEMERLAGTHDIILTWRYSTYSPTIDFFAPDVRPAARWTVNDHLPLGTTFARPVVMFLDPTVRSAVDEARRLYPQAVIRELTAPSGGDPLAYEVILDHP